MRISPKTRVRDVLHLSSFEELLEWVELDSEDVEPRQSLAQFCEDHEIDIEEVLNILGGDEDEDVWSKSTSFDGGGDYYDDDDDDDDGEEETEDQGGDYYDDDDDADDLGEDYLDDDDGDY